MKIFVWIQPEILHKEFHLSEIDKFIINLIKKDVFAPSDIAAGTCIDADNERDLEKMPFLDLNHLIIKSKGNIFETMTRFLKDKFHPDILIANEEYGKVLSDNLGYPRVILPPEIDLLNEIFQKKVWKDVGINMPFSILLRSKKEKSYSYEYKGEKRAKSLTITENLEKSVMDIIKEEGIDGL